MQRGLHNTGVKMSTLRASSRLLAHILSRRMTLAAGTSLKNALPLKSGFDFKVLSLGMNMSYASLYRQGVKTREMIKDEEIFSPKGASLAERIDIRLHNINMFSQRAGRVPEKGIIDLIDLIIKQGSCTPNQALFALRCCGSALVDLPLAERQALTNQLWNFILETNVKLTNGHFNTLLNVYIDNEQDFLPTDILALMDKHEAAPNRITFQHLVSKYCQVSLYYWYDFNDIM